ncbi:hypothetical protein PCAR4_760016 [Paraburkholderia caribensis]|nr:hypothetical protein PCAR4_760016 [Paraburkholderia caribensis]
MIKLTNPSQLLDTKSSFLVATFRELGQISGSQPQNFCSLGVDDVLSRTHRTNAVFVSY